MTKFLWFKIFIKSVINKNPFLKSNIGNENFRENLPGIQKIDENFNYWPLFANLINLDQHNFVVPSIIFLFFCFL